MDTEEVVDVVDLGDLVDMVDMVMVYIFFAIFQQYYIHDDDDDHLETESEVIDRQVEDQVAPWLAGDPTPTSRSHVL